MKTFNIPDVYKSNIIGKIKENRRVKDKLKKDFSPTVLDFGTVEILIARHFGFCYGVENAVEIAYKTLEEQQENTVYLLSEMIHNPDVNNDLVERGVKFLMDTSGNRLVDFKNLKKEDVVIVPAFGTTIEIQKELAEIGINPYQYDTTCPFVEKVWNRAAQIGERGYTVIVHGKPEHEETRATFSHSKEKAHTLVINDMEEAELLAKYIKKELPMAQFFTDFNGRYSENFDPEYNLSRMGVVNQTTMLAADTQAIADYIKETVISSKNLNAVETPNYFASTRDTLCYATTDNQEATYALLLNHADLAIVVGGYNSSNTQHLVELLTDKLPTYFIQSDKKLTDLDSITHFDLHQNLEISTKNYLPNTPKPKIILTCGASCPDSIVEKVLLKILSFYNISAVPSALLDF